MICFYMKAYTLYLIKKQIWKFGFSDLKKVILTSLSMYIFYSFYDCARD